MKKVAEELRFFDVQPNYFNFDRIDLSGCTFRGLFPGVCDARSTSNWEELSIASYPFSSGHFIFPNSTDCLFYFLFTSNENVPLT